MLKEDQEIAFTNDIIDEVARELKIPRDKVEQHIKFLVHYIKTLVKDPNKLVISIPHIGRMYANIGATEKELEAFSHIPIEDMPDKWLVARKRNKDRIEAFKRWYGDRFDYTRHKKKQKIYNHYFTKGKSLKELEIWQNKDL